MTVKSPLNLPELHDSLSTLAKNSEDFEEAVRKIKELYETQDINTKNGISLLELKNHTMLHYLMNMLILTLRKVEGKDIEDVRWRPIENRTVIERIRPIEQKLQYQIDKILKSGTDKTDAALKYKPQLDDLESSDDEQHVGDSEETGKYKVPKVAAVHYYEPEPKGKKKAEEAGPKLGRGILEDLRQDMSSAPLESSYSNVEKQTKRARERTDFEESNFIRMNLSKAEKKKPRLQSGLNSILDFDDQEMFRSAEAERGGAGKRGKKGKGKKGKKFKKRR